MIKNITKPVLLICIFVFSLSCELRAEDASLAKQVKELKQLVSQLQRTVQKQQKTIESLQRKIEEKQREEREFSRDFKNKLDNYLKQKGTSFNLLEGLRIGAKATFIMQGTYKANNNAGYNDTTDASYSADLELEKEFSDYGKAYFHFEAGDGNGVNDDLKVFSGVNADATGQENFDLIEAWYEQYFKSVPLVLTFGKLDSTCYIDTNEYANDETTQFLGSIFKNSPVLELPDGNGPGVRVNFSPYEFLEIELLAVNAKGSWEKFLNEMFFAAQVDFKTNFFSREGNYRIYSWVNDKNHIRWDDVTKTKEKNFGFGLSIEVYAQGADFSLKQSWSAGFQVSGGFWQRKDDILGIAFGQIIPSADYKKANNLRAKSEKHLEVYYNFKVNDHLSLSPDIQLIWDPYGGDAPCDDTILVGGLRGQVDF